MQSYFSKISQPAMDLRVWSFFRTWLKHFSKSFIIASYVLQSKEKNINALGNIDKENAFTCEKLFRTLHLVGSMETKLRKPNFNKNGQINDRNREFCQSFSTKILSIALYRSCFSGGIFILASIFEPLQILNYHRASNQVSKHFEPELNRKCM